MVLAETKCTRPSDARPKGEEDRLRFAAGCSGRPSRGIPPATTAPALPPGSRPPPRHEKEEEEEEGEAHAVPNWAALLDLICCLTLPDPHVPRE
eukprot:8448298-Pyramimonas_sp.AAC.1